MPGAQAWRIRQPERGNVRGRGATVIKNRLRIAGRALGWLLLVGALVLGARDINSLGNIQGPNTGGQLDGRLDEVWAFDNALTQQEITSLFTNNVVPEPSTFPLILVGLASLRALGARRSRGRKRFS